MHSFFQFIFRFTCRMGSRVMKMKCSVRTQESVLCSACLILLLLCNTVLQFVIILYILFWVLDVIIIIIIINFYINGKV